MIFARAGWNLTHLWKNWTNTIPSPHRFRRNIFGEETIPFNLCFAKKAIAQLCVIPYLPRHDCWVMVQWKTKNTPGEQQVLFVKFSSFEFFCYLRSFFISNIYVFLIILFIVKTRLLSSVISIKINPASCLFK